MALLSDTASYVKKDEVNNTLRIDVAKMLGLGKQLMSKGTPYYA